MRLPSLPVRIVAAALVLALGLVGLVVREGAARAGGQEVRLAITGYDPRSLLTGHYVQFRLQDTLPQEQVCRVVGAEVRGRPETWFAVRREGDGHRIVAVAPSRAAALKLGEVAVRGSAQCYGMVARRPGQPPRVSYMSVSLDVGVDRIHLEQGEAKALEAALRGEGEPPGSRAVLSVDRAGKARLKGVVVGNRRADLDWF